MRPPRLRNVTPASPTAWSSRSVKWANATSASPRGRQPCPAPTPSPETVSDPDPVPMPATDQPARLVEHFFRHETGRLHGALVRMLGVQNLSLAEDVAQEAMLRAMRSWSMGGIPPNF